MASKIIVKTGRNKCDKMENPVLECGEKKRLFTIKKDKKGNIVTDIR